VFTTIEALQLASDGWPLIRAGLPGEQLHLNPQSQLCDSLNVGMEKRLGRLCSDSQMQLFALEYVSGWQRTGHQGKGLFGAKTTTGRRDILELSCFSHCLPSWMAMSFIILVTE
jgi:hypothetical protein